MTGSNVLKLNQQTMCEALQTWLDKNLTGAGVTTVTEVKAPSGNSSSYDEAGWFEVTVSTEPAKA